MPPPLGSDCPWQRLPTGLGAGRRCLAGGPTVPRRGAQDVMKTSYVSLHPLSGSRCIFPLWLLAWGLNCASALPSLSATVLIRSVSVSWLRVWHLHARGRRGQTHSCVTAGRGEQERWEASMLQHRACGRQMGRTNMARPQPACTSQPTGKLGTTSTLRGHAIACGMSWCQRTRGRAHGSDAAPESRCASQPTAGQSNGLLPH